jgi:hypothetical protein
MSPEILRDLVKKALKTLDGDWVIIGGTVLSLVDASYRSTIDIDMMPVQNQGNESLLALMELASSLKLPVESINSAGLFFLKKIPDWKKRLEVHAQSKSCRILRPNFDLYLELKLERLSESDASDIEAFWKWYRSKKKSYDIERCQVILKEALKKDADAERRLKILELAKKLDFNL